MQYLILLLAATTLASAAHINKRLNFTIYCSTTTPDDSTCAQAGLTSYCCSDSKRGKFTIRKEAFMESYNTHGQNTCADGGRIYCV
ncbi:hypothetical protein E4U43_000415 [Claviceps pusilla]|uniref:Uncharacterized protein n=1 Tax=Claviceps pusilla TaxID=123648 RepID=A0A9P7SWR3_9HYPO|nr:hypothetical protein E4U43_000415 [Claviceps pusilla]